MRRVPDITELLNRWSAGDGLAFEELVPLIYADLKRVARRALGNEQHALTHFSPLRWSTKPTCGWSIRPACTGADGRTSSEQPRR